MNAIETSALTKKYQDITAVDGLTLCIKEGEIFSLLGVNGAGKSTAIKMLSGLIPPTSGNATLDGYDLLGDPMAVKTVINVSPQETAVAPGLSVRENLELIAGLYGADKKEARRMATEIIAEFSMEEVEKKSAGTLSGGWQRRLSIAMALISKPKILFLDEPTLGLDVLARRELQTIVKKLHGKMTIVLTTHYLEEAELLSDRIAVMAHGKLVALGTAEELKKLTGTSDFENAFIALATEGGMSK